MVLCKDCDFCVKNMEHGNLECRLNPPQIVLIPAMTEKGPAVNLQCLFPMVPLTGWCSRGFSEKENGAANE